MTIAKAHWDTDGDAVRLSMPFSKIDRDKRTVSGFATLDNVDKQQDIVTAEASMNAFKRFRGNVREMHQPSAIGKMVNFKEEKYFDPETKNFYRGVYVSAYVSKGAQDAWEKVLDGTYTGFSIGGKMLKWDDAYDEKMESEIRVIKEYDLVELSLVDSPANQFASILSVEKVDGVDILKGIDADTEIENVFWDPESDLVLISDNEAELSPSSGDPMQNIGFVEKNDDEKKEMIKFLIDGAKGINTVKMTKEVSPMTDATEDLTEKADEAVSEEVVEKSEEVAPEADAVESEVEKSEDMDEKEKSMKDKKMEEEEDMEDEAEKSYDEKEEEEAKKSDESEEVSKADESTAVEAVAEIKDTLTSAFSDLAETVKFLNNEISELKKSIGSVSEEVSATKQNLGEATERFDEFGKRVDAVEQDTAFRKSGDLGEIVQDQPEMVEKSLWGGRFLKTADLFK